MGSPHVPRGSPCRAQRGVGRGRSATLAARTPADGGGSRGAWWGPGERRSLSVRGRAVRLTGGGRSGPCHQGMGDHGPSGPQPSSASAQRGRWPTARSRGAHPSEAGNVRAVGDEICPDTRARSWGWAPEGWRRRPGTGGATTSGSHRVHNDEGLDPCGALAPDPGRAIRRRDPQPGRVRTGPPGGPHGRRGRHRPPGGLPWWGSSPALPRPWRPGPWPSGWGTASRGRPPPPQPVASELAALVPPGARPAWRGSPGGRGRGPRAERRRSTGPSSTGPGSTAWTTGTTLAPTTSGPSAACLARGIGAGCPVAAWDETRTGRGRPGNLVVGHARSAVGRMRSPRVTFVESGEPTASSDRSWPRSTGNVPTPARTCGGAPDVATGDAGRSPPEDTPGPLGAVSGARPRGRVLAT
ncbi:hypothetical protein BH24ACT4_BH24ACT4_01410 [soil metagenome]